MLKVKVIAILISIIFLSFAEMVIFEPNAKIDDRIAIILQTLSARSGVAVPSGIFQQPMNYAEIRDFLDKVEKSEKLTQTDKEFLAILQKKYSGNNGFFGFSDGDGKRRILANLDLTGSFRSDFKDSAKLDAYGMISPRITANLGIISFYSDMDLWTQYRSDTVWYGHDYQPFHGQTFNLIGSDDSAHIRAMDGFRGGISAQFKYARIDIAVDNLTSGPAVYNKLILNAVDKPIFYTRFMLDFKRIQYYQIFGVLQELKNYNKFLYYHRAQIPFWNNKITLGLSASIISGSIADSATMAEPHGQVHRTLNRERKVEPVYMIPLLPYVFAEHYGGDLDNKQMAIDIELKLPQIARWYVEFLIDDAESPNTIFNNWWGNKWALTFGTQWFPVIAGKNTIFNLEYCRVEPWVYTHFDGVATNYEHYGKSIGAELGPNSAQIRGLSQIYLTHKHGVKLEAVHNRYNRNVRGGNIGDVFVEDGIYDIYPNYDGTIDSKTKEFLGKNYTTEYEITLSHLFRQFSRYEMETSIYYNNRKGIGIGLWGGFRF